MKDVSQGKKAVIFICGILLGIFLTIVSHGSQCVIERNQTKTVYVDISLDEVTFKIVPHDSLISENTVSTVDTGTYHSDEYLIRVYRVGKTYYIKIYQEWDFGSK